MKVENNFSDILTEKSLLYPNKVYCHKINGRSITFLELEQYVNKCCRFYEEMGVVSGEIVTISIPNSISSIVFYLAGIRSGIKVNPCPSTSSENELIKNVNFVESKLLITQQLIDANNLSANCSYFKFNDDNDLLLELESYGNQKYEREIGSDDVACIYYSSGTTGNSKCVLYSHKNMLSNIKSVVNDLQFHSESIHLGVLPLGHTSITNYQFLPSLFAGSTLILAENFNSVRADIWKIVADFNITYLQVVPTILFAMMATPYDDEDVKSNSSLKYIGCGSAPLSIESQISFYEKFNVKVANLYGLSETGPSHFDNPLLPDWKPGSIGYPLTVNDCKIFSKDLNELKVGEIGQIGLKGENIFVGYYKNEKAYKNSFFNDYFLTGDLGYKDETGKYYFADREKDLIIKGGVNIVPGEIEEIIFKLENVQSAAVIGVPHELFGEEIIAFVEKKDRSLKKRHVVDILAENLQPLKRPNRIIFIENMPVGPSGKILKRKLREELDVYESNEMTSHDLYQACQKIVIEAGVIIETEKKREYKIIRKSQKELVTEIDLVVQNYLTKALGAINDCDIYYEEDRSQGGKILLKECFIIDPIDATHNLVAGLPFYNLSIGYVKNGVLMFGIIYFPYSKDIYKAYKGEGAYKNLDQISVSINPVLEKSIIAYDNQFYLDQSIMINYQKLVETVFTTRILGSANRDACFVAEGVLDARVWNSTKVHDIVAGSIIVSEAGGLVTDFNAQPINLGNINKVVMSNGGIHQELLELIG